MENSTTARGKHISDIAIYAEPTGQYATHNGYVEHVGCQYAKKGAGGVTMAASKSISIHSSLMMGAMTILEMDSLFQRDQSR